MRIIDPFFIRKWYVRLIISFVLAGAITEGSLILFEKPFPIGTAVLLLGFYIGLTILYHSTKHKTQVKKKEFDPEVLDEE